MQPKTIADPVHGQIKVNDYLWEIIDTETFQRLRNLKQLGLCDYVFPSATHSRFTHSIGTCYIAKTLLDHLQEQSSVNLREEDYENVQIAALCHDLGHGPYSHL